MSVYSLCYVSRALLPSAEAKSAVADIVDVSRERNGRLKVTGALLFTGAHFAQVLEGSRAAVRELMLSIERDARHTDVTIVREGLAETRAFGAWTLAYAGPSTFIDSSILTCSPESLPV
jgi:hypothetical protein